MLRYERSLYVRVYLHAYTGVSERAQSLTFVRFLVQLFHGKTVSMLKIIPEFQKAYVVPSPCAVTFAAAA